MGETSLARECRTVVPAFQVVLHALRGAALHPSSA